MIRTVTPSKIDRRWRIRGVFDCSELDPKEMEDHQLFWIVNRAEFTLKVCAGYVKERYLSEIEKRRIAKGYHHLRIVRAALDNYEWESSRVQWDDPIQAWDDYIQGFLGKRGLSEKEWEYAQIFDLRVNESEGEPGAFRGSCYELECEQIGYRCDSCNVNLCCDDHLCFYRLFALCPPCDIEYRGLPTLRKYNH